MEIVVANKYDWTHPHMGGVEVNLRETLTRLADRGHTVHLFCAHYPGAEQEEHLDGVHIKRCGREGQTNEIWLHSIGQIAYNRFIREIKPDVIYSVHSPLPLFNLTHIPELTAYHHINGRTFFDRFEFPRNLAAYLYEKIGIWTARYTKTITVSQFTKNKLVEHGHSDDSIEIVHNGVDVDTLYPNGKADTPQILFLGRLEQTKGVDRLPEIYERIESDIEFHIAGYGEYTQKMASFSESNDDVTFHGYVDDDMKRHLLQQAWCVVMPSRVEGWGMVAIEANACGTPVIGMDVGGLQEAIDHGRSGFISSSIDEMVGYVNTIITDKNVREQFDDTVRHHAQQFSWDKTTEQLEQKLQEIQ